MSPLSISLHLSVSLFYLPIGGLIIKLESKIPEGIQRDFSYNTTLLAHCRKASHFSDRVQSPLHTLLRNNSHRPHSIRKNFDPIQGFSKSLPKGTYTLKKKCKSKWGEKHKRTGQIRWRAGIREFITNWDNPGRGSWWDAPERMGRISTGRDGRMSCFGRLIWMASFSSRSSKEVCAGA